MIPKRASCFNHIRTSARRSEKGSRQRAGGAPPGRVIVIMERKFTLEYRIDDSWYVSRLKEVPGVFSQGETLEELEDNIADE